MKLLRLFMQHAGGHVAIALVLSGVGGLLAGGGVLKLQALIASGQVTYQDAIIVAALGIGQTAASIGARVIFGQGLFERVVAQLRRSVTHTVAASRLRDAEKSGSPRIWAAIDVNAILVARAGASFVTAARSVTMAIACFVALALTAPSLVPGALAAVLVGFGLYTLVARRAKAAAEKSQKLQEVVDRHVDGLTKGNRELRQNASRRYAFLTEGLLPSIHDFQSTAARSSIWNTAAARMLGVPVMALVGWTLFAHATEDAKPSALASSVVILLFLQAELMGVLAFGDQLRRGNIAYGRISQILNELRTTEARGNVSETSSSFSSIKLENVTAKYSSEDGVRDFTLGPVNLSLVPGEVVFIIGGNGSGKSTLAKVITGLYTPDAGAVTLDGKAVDDASRESYRQLFAAIFANHHVYRRLFGIEGTDVDARGTELLKEMELAGKIQIKDAAYSTVAVSSGQRKRLSMVTSRLEDRKILLFDEWASDQDPRFRDLFYRVIIPALKKEGRTVLVISHDDRYFDSADRIVRLEDGKIVHDGKPVPRKPSLPPPTKAAEAVAT